MQPPLLSIYVHFDNLFLSFFRGKTFESGKSTISTVGTICTGKSVGISVDVNVFQPHILAANLAHAIGKQT